MPYLPRYSFPYLMPRTFFSQRWRIAAKLLGPYIESSSMLFRCQSPGRRFLSIAKVCQSHSNLHRRQSDNPCLEQAILEESILSKTTGFCGTCPRSNDFHTQQAIHRLYLHDSLASPLDTSESPKAHQHYKQHPRGRHSTPQSFSTTCTSDCQTRSVPHYFSCRYSTYRSKLTQYLGHMPNGRTSLSSSNLAQPRDFVS